MSKRSQSDRHEENEPKPRRRRVTFRFEQLHQGDDPRALEAVENAAGVQAPSKPDPSADKSDDAEVRHFGNEQAEAEAKARVTKHLDEKDAAIRAANIKKGLAADTPEVSPVEDVVEKRGKFRARFKTLAKYGWPALIWIAERVIDVLF